MLVPEPTEPKLIERDGLLVVSGVHDEEIPDHRQLREERLADLARLDDTSS